MSAIPLRSAQNEAARAAYAALAQAQGSLLHYIALDAPPAYPLSMTALGQAIEAVTTAMKRLNDIVDMTNAALGEPVVVMPVPERVQ